MKTAYLPGVVGVLKGEDTANNVIMLLATLLGNEREKSTKDKSPSGRAHLLRALTLVLPHLPDVSPTSRA